MKRLILLSFLVCFAAMSFGQDYQFKNRGEKSKAPEHKIAFKILGVTSDEHAGQVELAIQSIPGIASAKISYSYKCRIEVTDVVSASSVRDVLLENETDFYFPSLDVSNTDLYKNLHKYREAMMPDDFPEKPSQMNDQEEKAYKRAVYEWRKRYPQKYGMLVELGYVSE